MATALTETKTTADALARAFLEALIARDFDGLRALLAPGAGMRVLTPLKVLEDAGAEAVVRRFSLWYADATHLDVHESRSGILAARGVISYGFRTWTDEGAFDITQQGFIDAREGRIHRIDLVCSGFLPVEGSA